MKEFVDKSSCILTCVYCGMEYPNNTPSWNSEVLTDHIRNCEKHPMRKLEENNAKLRKALIGLVGVETEDELKNMEAMIRAAPIPDVDKMVTINAITALIDTLF